ncbi:MAG: GNAT family N-acetyltransferase [Verrucomicrobiota bacterium]|nr:GNAT family N-acetyltransferase [Verrucomicrobiota bacterium]
MDYAIRPLKPEDEPTLWEMLFLAVNREGESADREVVRRPELARYVEGWGREGDRGFVAQELENGPVLGAAWLRLPIGEHKGYGFVDEGTPELAFAVHPAHRQRGIATALLTQLARSTVDEEAISLSAAAGNPARRLYERFGFKVVQESPEAIKMQR